MRPRPSAILARVDFLVDNLPALSAVFFGLVVLAALGLLGLRALQLWRTIKATKATAQAQIERLGAEGERISAALEAMPRRQAELRQAAAVVQQRIAFAQMLGGFAGQAVTALRTPLKYLGG